MGGVGVLWVVCGWVEWVMCMLVKSSHTGILLFADSAFFRCYVCQDTKKVEIDRGRIAEPAVCTHCQTLHSMVLIHNLSEFMDKQMVKLQESPDDVPPGQVSNLVMLHVHGNLVHFVQPGDR